MFNSFLSDDISRLEYTSRFIKESLRMIPPVPGHDRVLAEPVTIDGVTFPAKTGVQVSSWCLHHNPAVWENHNVRHEGYYLSAHVVLNLLNKLGNRHKMRGLPSIYCFCSNEFTNLILQKLHC